jgi:ABC-type bacteriocin/lantibiotic exporter with double-glycine peptidase domain
LLSIANEVDKTEGQIAVNGRVFYVSQQPWIFPASIKQNITFGNEFIKEKFDQIIDVCALKPDLDTMPFGENTLIGEKGTTLSGGQKARISLLVLFQFTISSYFLVKYVYL